MKKISFTEFFANEIYHGRKTQTRRLIEPQPDVKKRRHRYGMSFDPRSGLLTWGRAPWYKSDPDNHFIEREAFSDFLVGDIFSVDGSNVHCVVTDIEFDSVSVISEKDAIAEGCYGRITNIRYDHLSVVGNRYEVGGKCDKTTPIQEFQKLWDGFYPGSWDRGDFVWIYKFRKVENL